MKWKEHNKFQLFPRTLKKFGKFMLKCHKKEQKLEIFCKMACFEVASSKQQFSTCTQLLHLDMADKWCFACNIIFWARDIVTHRQTHKCRNVSRYD